MSKLTIYRHDDAANELLESENFTEIQQQLNQVGDSIAARNTQDIRQSY